MSVLLLADAKAHLNITNTVDDTELQTFIDAAEAAIGSKIGPLGSVSRTDRVRGAGKDLVLPVCPVISLTSVTPVGGTALDPSSMVVDYKAGVIAYVAATQYNFARFPLPWYDVTYTAGRNVTASANPDLYQAIKEQVRHLWSTQRGPTSNPVNFSGDSPSQVGMSYTFSNRVLEMIAPYMAPGFA